MAKVEEQNVPLALAKILKYDAEVTTKFVIWANNILKFPGLDAIYLFLNISGFGIPLYIFWIPFTFLFNNPHLAEMQANMFLGTFLDSTLLVGIKVYFKRNRPIIHDDRKSGIDLYSFPSGHASKSTFFVYFFTRLYPLNSFFCAIITLWAVAVSLSRITMRRHYILDVLGGILLGLFVGLLLESLWIGEETAKSLLSYK